MKKQKSEVITFKADSDLLEAMKGIPNRSEFIRNAVLQALDSTCPLCQGTGIMSSDQKRHWDKFARDHALRECRDCHELYLECVHEVPGN